MDRRTALRTLFCGVTATVTGSAPAPSPRGPGPRDQVAALLGSLSRDRAHLVVAEPDSGPSPVWDPIVELLEEQGEPLFQPDLTRPTARRKGILLLDEPDFGVRRLWLELRELDRQARQGRGMVLARLQRQQAHGLDWIPWFGEVVECVVRVRGLEFDGPPELVPASYRVPVELYRQGQLVAVSSLVIPVQ